ncbi:MAG: hypothetical protein KDB14_11930 [Planctomycetales bacterium]|nr:hypothetical protein [Planctomycetales bacterium]
MSRTFASCALCALIVSNAFAQDGARRLGPTSILRSHSPRVVEVQAKEPARGEVSDETPAAKSAEPAAPSTLEQLAAARLEVAQRQIERLAPYNQYALPGQGVYLQSQVLPPAEMIEPVRTGDPVQLFQPGSTFSHVLRRAGENEELAALTLQAEAAKSAAAQSAVPAEPVQRSEAEIAADLQLTEAKLASAQARLAQLESLSQAAYSQLFRNLGDKLQLEVYEAQLQYQALLKEAGAE